MLLSDKPGRRRVLSALGSGLLLVALAACQAQPLYGSHGATAALATVGVSEPTSRVEQQVRNELVFLLSGGAGEPQNPIYQLQLHVTASNANFLSQISSNFPRPGRVTLNATYVLTRDGKVVKQGKQKMDALLDFTSQQFAQIRAIRDAENRAARELAQLINYDIAAALVK